MQYKNFGNTGLLVSELCLGTMTFGGKGYWTAIGKLDQGPVDAIVKRAVEAGINFIDTANAYSEGLSEEMTGKAIRNLGLKRDDLIVATKVRAKMGKGVNESGLSRKHVFQQIDESLRRLNMDHVDLYQVHGFDSFTPLEETLRALDDIVKAGKIRYIGASNLAAWQLMKALSYSEYKEISKFISLQAYYTVAARDLERELVPLLQDQKVGLMVWSPLAGGFLSGKYKSDQAGSEDLRRKNFDFPPIDKDKVYRVLDVLEPMAKEKNVSIAQLALAWLLYQPVVSSVIIGAKKMEQLEDNLKSTAVRFSSEELKKIDEVSKLPSEYPGWMIAHQGADRRELEEKTLKRGQGD